MPNEHERAHSSPAVAPAVAPAASGSLLPRFHQLTNKQNLGNCCSMNAPIRPAQPTGTTMARKQLPQTSRYQRWK